MTSGPLQNEADPTCNSDILMTTDATILRSTAGARPQPSLKNGARQYSAHVRAMMAEAAGPRKMTVNHICKKPTAGPNASRMYV